MKKRTIINLIKILFLAYTVQVAAALESPCRCTGKRSKRQRSLADFPGNSC